MILIYVDNKHLDEVADIAERIKAEYGRISYRNPRLYDGKEDCDGVYIHGNYPKIESDYDNFIDLSHSTEFTVAEVKKKAEGMSEKELKLFIEGDTRKTVQTLLNG